MSHNIILVSNLCSTKIINTIIKETNQNPLQSIQKFLHSLCYGLKQNNINISLLSLIPLLPNKNLKISTFIKEKSADGIDCEYVHCINTLHLRHISAFFYIFLKILLFGKKNTIYACDILSQTTTLATFLACKIRKIKTIAIVTDLPNDIFSEKSIILKIQNKFDGYILLTKQMEKIINDKKKPFVVIEGLANDNKNHHSISKEKNSFTIMYAGGLYKKYGLENLINAFQKIDSQKLKLEFYGSGDMEDKINNLNDKRITFFGVKANSYIVQREKEVSLLINPRQNTKSYTKYSFPSKTMEYLASGTPTLMYKLDGIPKEYDNYIYYVKGNSVNDLKESIESIYTKSRTELMDFGKKAQEWVLKNKNPKIQTRKIIDLICNI